MSKNTKWITLFALLVLAYAASQVFEYKQGKEFVSPLMNFLPEQVSSIKIHESGKAAFQLIKLNDNWLLSVNNIHEQVEEKAVAQLLKLLKTIRTTEITSQRKKDWSEYKLSDHQGTTICIESNGQALPCVKFGSIRFSSEDNTLKAFARLEEEKEIFALNGFSISSLKSDFNDYRNKQIIHIDSPVRLKFSTDSTLLTVTKQNNQWLDEDMKLLDSLIWEKRSQKLANIRLTTFADDLDELAIDNKKIISIQLFTLKDSFRLDCYIDSTFEKPFILHSDQYPKTWMTCDSVTFWSLLPEGLWTEGRG